jgi:hypothetical protein
MLDDRHKVQGFAPELDASPRDARHIQEIIHEAGHVPKLTLHHLGHAFELARSVRPHPDELDAAP